MADAAVTMFASWHQIVRESDNRLFLLVELANQDKTVVYGLDLFDLDSYEDE